MPLHHALIIDAGWRHRVNVCAMQRTQRKLLDLANSMGISDQILRMAERRNKGDVMLVYGGMVCSCTQHSLASFFNFFLIKFDSGSYTATRSSMLQQASISLYGSGLEFLVSPSQIL
jgi:hypothetical protein